jgi:hypothetical protein
MIIRRAAVLGRETVSREEIRDAVSDVDEEVRRLTRLVSDVPISRGRSNSRLCRPT